jgi:uncharacterized protein DUF6174
MYRIVRLAPVVLLALVTGCSDTTAPVSLRVNRVRWERQNLHDYAYVGERFCFCAPEGKVSVTVISDRVASVRVIATGVQLATDSWYTVDQLFDLAQRSFEEKDRTVSVEYDPELGYPTLIDIACTGIPECGERLEVSHLGGYLILFDS